MNALTTQELYDLLPQDHPFEGWKPILGDGPEEPDLVLVKPYPGPWDAGSDRTFAGKDGVTIRQVMLNQELKPYTTTVVPFFGGKGKTVRKTHAEAASRVLTTELERVNPGKVLLFGVNAARWLPDFGVPFTRFNEIVGRVFEVGNISYGVTHATTAIANSPGVFKDFTRTLDLLKGKVVRERKVLSEVYVPVTSALTARTILAQLPERVALDLETTGTDPYQDHILTLNVSWREGRGFAFPWTLFNPGEWADLLSGRGYVCQNGVFDLKFLASQGVFLRLDEDTLLMHSVLDETPGTHSMELLSHKYLGIDKWGDTVDYDALKYGLTGMENPAGLGAEATQSFDVVGRYGARDTDITLRLANVFKPQVQNRFVNEVLHRAQNALMVREHVGVRVDRERAFDMSEEIEGVLHDKREYLEDVYGLENPNSVAQVKALLYDEMGMPVQRSRGSVTTSSPYIEPFKEEYPVIRDILEYRSLVKCNSTYLKRILDASDYDGRYHPDIRLAATETGRVTEKLIALIPRPDDIPDNLGKQYQAQLRSLFLPDEGYVMVGADLTA